MNPDDCNPDYYSQKSDVFSYSLILYELLTLRNPYSDQPGIDLSNISNLASREERPTINNNEITPAYEELLRSCWEKEYDERLSSIEIVKKFIENKDEFFNLDQEGNQKFSDYIDLAKKDLVI